MDLTQKTTNTKKPDKTSVAALGNTAANHTDLAGAALDESSKDLPNADTRAMADPGCC